MSSLLVAYGKKEMQLAGLYDKDADYGPMVAECVEELLKVIARQGHSGMSQMKTIALFTQLAQFKPLSPVGKDPAEWMEVGPGVWQNTRKGSLFSKNGGKTFYDIDRPMNMWQKLTRYLNNL